MEGSYTQAALKNRSPTLNNSFPEKTKSSRLITGKAKVSCFLHLECNFHVTSGKEM